MGRQLDIATEWASVADVVQGVPEVEDAVQAKRSRAVSKAVSPPISPVNSLRDLVV